MFEVQSCISIERACMFRLVRQISLLIFALSVSIFAHSQSMKVHFIDVGQGAATLVEFPCAAILVDTGGEKNAEFDSNSSLMEYLNAFFSGRPDLKNTLHSVILTHPHIDHTRGVQSVLSKFKILNGVTNGLDKGSGKSGQVALNQKIQDMEDSGASVGFFTVWEKDIPSDKGLTNQVIDPVKCQAVDPKITALWGQVSSNSSWSASEFSNANNHSVVLRIDFGKSSMLISGDLELKGIEELLRKYENTNLLKTNLLVVNHHGAANGTTDQFMKATSPSIAVIQMGPAGREVKWTAWDYGHPRKSTVDTLVDNVTGTRPTETVYVASKVHEFEPFELSRSIYGTGWDGSIVLEADTKGIWKPFGSDQGQDLVNINTADVSELVRLPLIGTSRANAIVEYRQKNGPFKSVEDLMKVSRIKSGTINALRNLVKLSD